VTRETASEAVARADAGGALWRATPDKWCLNGWGPPERSACPGSYTGGHYCGRGYQHPGRCVCEGCGSTTTLPAPVWSGP
jgi:hypothetical protein